MLRFILDKFNGLKDDLKIQQVFDIFLGIIKISQEQLQIQNESSLKSNLKH